MAAAPIAKRLVLSGSETHKAILLGYCNRLIKANKPEAAVDIWNSLVDNGLPGFATLKPELGVSLSNSEFSEPPLLHGFDWRIPNTKGITVRHSSASKSLLITFSGRQPESCNLLVQYIPLIPHSIYRLKCVYGSSGVPPDSGLLWRVYSTTGVMLTSPSAEPPGLENLVFQTGAETGLARLVLRYERTPGTVRNKGSVVLHKVILQILDRSPHLSS